MDYFQIDLASHDHRQLDSATSAVASSLFDKWDNIRGPIPLPKDASVEPPLHSRRIRLVIGDVKELHEVRGILAGLSGMELPTDVSVSVKDHCKISSPTNGHKSGSRHLGLGGTDSPKPRVGNDASERAFISAAEKPRDHGEFGSVPSYEGDDDFKY